MISILHYFLSGKTMDHAPASGGETAIQYARTYVRVAICASMYASRRYRNCYGLDIGFFAVIWTRRMSVVWMP